MPIDMSFFSKSLQESKPMDQTPIRAAVSEPAKPEVSSKPLKVATKLKEQKLAASIEPQKKVKKSPRVRRKKIFMA